MFDAPPPLVRPTPTSAQVSSLPFGFAGGDLGETLAAWRDARPSRHLSACKPDGQRPGLTVCKGSDAPLGGGFFAHQLTYTFLNGRLAGISFRSSIDAFDFVTAALKHNFSLPDEVVRDRISDSHRASRFHVRMRWRNGRSTITLNDPIPNATQLQVSFTLDAAEKQLPSGG